MARPSQWALLGSRRFAPFFVAQGLGAFNDSLYKQALILAILFKLKVVGNPSLWVNLCALLFVLPFFLFSALGGQLGEKYPKQRLIRRLNLAELLLMPAAAAGLLLDNLPLMLFVLFLMGAQAALFGPVKYSILPEHLAPRDLVGGNALVEMATFLAILGGTIAAGTLLSYAGYRPLVAAVVLVTALLAWLASLAIPGGEAAYPQLSLDWHLPRQMAATLRLGLQQDKSVSFALLGNAWFWFLGTVYLTQIPAYAKNYLHGGEALVSLILTLFSVGVALGSLLCGRLSRQRLRPGLVPIGAIGLSLFGVALWFFSDQRAFGGIGPNAWLGLLGHWQAWAALLCIVGLGASGGLYIVPLYALIQARTAAQQRARVIAANNILNTLFMVLASLLSIVLLVLLKVSIPGLFLWVSLFSLAVNLYLFSAVPEFVQGIRRPGG